MKTREEGKRKKKPDMTSSRKYPKEEEKLKVGESASGILFLSFSFLRLLVSSNFFFSVSSPETATSEDLLVLQLSMDLIAVALLVFLFLLQLLSASYFLNQLKASVPEWLCFNACNPSSQIFIVGSLLAEFTNIKYFQLTLMMHC